jgi:hypothetical protein
MTGFDTDPEQTPTIRTPARATGRLGHAPTDRASVKGPQDVAYSCTAALYCRWISVSGCVSATFGAFMAPDVPGLRSDASLFADPDRVEVDEHLGASPCLVPARVTHKDELPD